MKDTFPVGSYVHLADFESLYVAYGDDKEWGNIIWLVVAKSNVRGETLYVVERDSGVRMTFPARVLERIDIVKEAQNVIRSI